MNAARRLDPVILLALPAVLYLAIIYGIPLLGLLGRSIMVAGMPSLTPSSASCPIRSAGP